jgi:hypothetical protein
MTEQWAPVRVDPNPENDQMPTAADLCQHCRHAWHGLRCHCGCLTAFEPSSLGDAA